MPRYDYRCRSCDDRFEVRRSVYDVDAAATCPNGHADTVRLLSTFATSARAVAGINSGVSTSAAGGQQTGGCCGGGCGCR